MTALGGMSLLMEGSTIREGKYKDNIKRATDWLMARAMPNGMLGNPNIPGEAGSVVTTLDGFQMAKQGRAGPALAIAAIASFFAAQDGDTEWGCARLALP